MNHLIRLYAAAAVCLLGLAACQDEVLEGGGAKGCVEILARMGDEMRTRTCVDGPTVDDAVGILWTPGDSIA